MPGARADPSRSEPEPESAPGPWSSGAGAAQKSGSSATLFLANLLDDFKDDCHKITGHSFWAAIPSALSSFPDENSVKDIKEWGSWESSCYSKYMKHEREKKHAVTVSDLYCRNNIINP